MANKSATSRQIQSLIKMKQQAGEDITDIPFSKEKVLLEKERLLKLKYGRNAYNKI